VASHLSLSLDHCPLKRAKEVQVGRVLRDSMAIPIGATIKMFRVVDPRQVQDGWHTRPNETEHRTKRLTKGHRSSTINHQSSIINHRSSEKSLAAWWPPGTAERIGVTALDRSIIPAKSAIREAANGLCLTRGSVLFVRAFGTISRLEISSAHVSPFPISHTCPHPLLEIFLVGPNTAIDVESLDPSQTTQNSSDEQQEQEREEDQTSSSSSSPPSSEESSFSLLIGGLETEIQQLKELIDLSFEHADLFRSFGEQLKD